MAYGKADEALSLFSWLKIVSGELSQDWDKSKYNQSHPSPHLGTESKFTC